MLFELIEKYRVVVVSAPLAYFSESQIGAEEQLFRRVHSLQRNVFFGINAVLTFKKSKKMRIRITALAGKRGQFYLGRKIFVNVAFRLADSLVVFVVIGFGIGKQYAL